MNNARIVPEEIQFTNLQQVASNSLEQKKYAVIFDKTDGLPATFYHYKARCVDFNKELLKAQAQK